MSKNKGKKLKFIPIKEFESNNSKNRKTPSSGFMVSLGADSSKETNQSINLCTANKSSSFEKSVDLSNNATPSNFKPGISNYNTMAKKLSQNPRKTPRIEEHQRRINVYKSDNSGDKPEQNLEEHIAKYKTNDVQHLPVSTSVEDQPKMIDNKRNRQRNEFVVEEAHNWRPSTSEIHQDIPNKFSGESKSGVTAARIFVPKKQDIKSEAKYAETDDWEYDNNTTSREYNVTEKKPGGNKSNNYYFRNSPRLPTYDNKIKFNQENVWHQNDYTGREKDRNKGDFRKENNTVNNSNQIRTTEDNGGTSGEKYHRKDYYQRQEKNNYHERQSRSYNSNYNSETSRYNQKQPYGRKSYNQITPNDKRSNRENIQKDKHLYTSNWNNSKNRGTNKSWQSNNEDTENTDNTDTLTDTNNDKKDSQERSWNVEYKEGPANISGKDEYVENSYASGDNREESCTEGFDEKPANTSREEEYESSNINRSNQEESWVDKFNEKPTTIFGKDEYEESNNATKITQEKSWADLCEESWADQCEEEIENKSKHDEDEEWPSNQHWESQISRKTRDININEYDCFDTSQQNNNQNRRSEPAFNERFSKLRRDKPRYSDTMIQRPGAELYDKSFEKEDKEYAEFNKENLKQVIINYGKTKEQQHDLFMMPKDYSLAHCVAEDFRMGSGIAVQFKRDFKEVGNLLAQRQKQGGLAVLENQTKEGKRYIYYLVTKTFSTGKPTYQHFWSSLKKMRDHIRKNKVTKLAIPRLGCGLDRLEWSRVKSMIEYLFKNIDDMDIVICNFQQNEDSFSNSPQKDYSSCKVVNVEYPLVSIEPETIILYFTTEKGEQTKEMETLNEKFSFMSHHNSASRHLGQVIKYDKITNYVLYGCVVRKTAEDLFDFESFGKCLTQINKENKKNMYEYVGITPIEDVLLHEQILTLMKTMLKYVCIYVCRHNSNWSDDCTKIKPFTN